MLGKLIKHEFKATGRVIPLIYLAVAFMLFLSYLAQLFKVPMFTGIVTFLLFAACFAGVIVTLVVVLVRYYKSMFSAEGYLTQSLPVSAKNLVFSKAVVGFIWLLSSYVVCFGAAAIYMWFMGVFDAEFQNELNIGLQALGIGGTDFIISVIILGAVLITIQLVLSLILIYLAMTVANVSPFNKLGGVGAFVYYIAFNFVFQIIDFVLIMFIPFSVKFTGGKLKLTTEMMGTQLLNDKLNENVMPVIGLGSYAFDLLAVAALVAVIVWLTQKKISLK